MVLEAGQKAPDFTLPDENGEPHQLSDYLGKTVLLYFYPKDDTPGCTTEACSFRDDYSDYKKAGVTILGVSPDSVASHTQFKEKHHLPFTLLADADHQVAALYGVWGVKKMFGKEFEGVYRTTFLINPEGIIQEVFERVNPKGHSEEVLSLLQA